MQSVNGIDHEHNQSSNIGSSFISKSAPTMWILPEHKLVWVSVAKNACTSIKWMLAGLTDQDLSRLYGSERALTERRTCVHDRARWRNVYKPRDLDDKGLEEISTENGWFIFAVVRDPRVRAFSAWQSKFLEQDPIYMRKFAGEAWLPRLPRTAEDVVSDFSVFVHWLAENPQHRIHNDPHFTSQYNRIWKQTNRYTKIYDVSELSTMLNDLSVHLNGLGITETPTLTRDNDSALAVRSELFDNGVREALEKVYAADFDEFGSRWDFDHAMKNRSEWSDAAFRDIAARASMGERIGDLVANIKTQRREIQRLSSRVSNLKGQVREQQARSGRLNRRIRLLFKRPFRTNLAWLRRRLHQKLADFRQR